MSENKKIKVEELKQVSRWITVPILLLVSAIFIITGIFAINKVNSDKKYYRETSAVITKIDTYTEYDKDADGDTTKKTVHDVYVTYTVDDTTYTNVKLPYYTAGMKEGQTITITYDYRNPGKPVISANTFFIIGIVAIVAGGLTILSIIVYSIIRIKNKKQEQSRIKKLMETGIVRNVTIDCILKSGEGQKFYSIIDGFDYSSPVIENNPELFTGCTINIYFQRDGYEQRKAQDKWHSNYYFDLNSVKKGKYQEPKLL